MTATSRILARDDSNSDPSPVPRGDQRVLLLTKQAMSLTFVHASDLHLDSPFVGVTVRAPEVAEALRRATFDAFDNVVRLCIDRRADFLLVAGDVYDGADRSLRAQLRFRDGLARLAARGIAVFVVHGNHDPLDGWSSAIEWPAGVHVFRDQVETVPVSRKGIPIAVVSGISYAQRQEHRNLARLFDARDARSGDAPFHVGLLHTNVGRNPEHDPYAPCDIADLLGRGVDYWALGHIHARQILCDEPHVVYPGNIQGRNIRETGARGCMVVEVDGDRLNLEFVPIDVVRWHALDCDISAIATVDALEAALGERIEGAFALSENRPSICRLRLGGRGPLYTELRRLGHAEQLLERLRERYDARQPFSWIEQIDLDCQPEFDIEQRRKSDDLGGEILRAAAAWREGDLRQALGSALGPLYSHYRLSKLLDAPDRDGLERLLLDAELLCLDRLDNAN